MKSNILNQLLVIVLLIGLALGQTCGQSQYFNGQRCAPCKANCLCSSQNSCSSCSSGYTFDSTFQNCVQCPLSSDAINVGCKQCCSQIFGTEFVCSECPDSSDTFLKGGQCIRMQGCLSLDDNGLCSSCSEQYYLSNGICVSCHMSCQKCQHQSLCLSCRQGYYNKSDVSYSLCQPCSLGCSSCISASQCEECSSGYRLQASSCIACGDPKCSSCSSSECTGCFSGTLVSGMCYSCNDTSRSGSVGCTSCSTIGNNIVCAACDSAYYLDQSSQCQLCSSKFAHSILCNFQKPLQCQNDLDANLSRRYYLLNGVCVSNNQNCKSMSSNGQCSECYFDSPNNFYRLNNGECQQCSSSGCSQYSSNCECLGCQGGYQFINGQCLPCDNSRCLNCQNDKTSCTKCITNYGRFSTTCEICQKANCNSCDGDYTICQTCADGYYLSDGTCYRCQTNCLKCTSNILCTQCDAKSYLQKTNKCKLLPNNCLEISYNSNDLATCQKCQYGYRILADNCYPCSTSTFNLKNCEAFCPSHYILLSGNNLLIGITMLILGLMI